jgi:hypothetical protein
VSETLPDRKLTLLLNLISSLLDYSDRNLLVCIKFSDVVLERNTLFVNLELHCTLDTEFILKKKVSTFLAAYDQIMNSAAILILLKLNFKLQSLA